MSAYHANRGTSAPISCFLAPALECIRSRHQAALPPPHSARPDLIKNHLQVVGPSDPYSASRPCSLRQAQLPPLLAIEVCSRSTTDLAKRIFN
ncbi:hypothetical protein KFK09_013698 [Dendrobium nobile]|uniref:Uncharacterized protein n=1 Tax=Dendrobium nobile TaxID=94219 RepID=A0A8T3BAE9_DENNO|nr:hypothetical protein KFK09_013698 [Dendrobium nobile]